MSRTNGLLGADGREEVGAKYLASRSRILIAVGLLAALLIATVTGTAGAQQMGAAPDLGNFGYTGVVASEQLQPGQAATVGSGQIQAEVPADAFTGPVLFEILQGDNSTFQPFAPAGETVAVNFAFRVTSLETGQLVGMFGAPVTAVVTDPSITQQSGYFNVKPTSPIQVEKNPVPPTISGNVLTHPNKGAPVGWVILNPASGTLADTGGFVSPMTMLLLGSAALVSLGGVVVVAAGLLKRRRLAS